MNNGLVCKKYLFSNKSTVETNIKREMVQKRRKMHFEPQVPLTCQPARRFQQHVTKESCFHSCPPALLLPIPSPSSP